MEDVPGFAPGSEESFGETPMQAGCSKMLGKLGLELNPFTDRTAEKSMLSEGAFYLHSDLQGFRPSNTTYLFFGKRGSGKSTTRMWMMQKYRTYNEELVAKGKGPCFVVDLCRPGHMDACLKEFMETIGAGRDNWDSAFAETWTSNDLADCIVSFAVNDMMRRVVTGSNEGKMMMEALSKNPRAATQFLLLAHIYTREDSATLNALRAKLLPITFSPWQLAKNIIAIGAVASCAAGAYFQLRGDTSSSNNNNNTSTTTSSFSSLSNFSLLPNWSYKQLGVLAGVGGAMLTTAALKKNRTYLSKARALEMCKPVRVSDARPELIESVLNRLFDSDDSADRIRGLLVGHNAQQKLELLENLIKSCGFYGVAVFGDCFDEVGLLDPLLYPTALKVFAREVCKNEVLNQGRLHFFFPDARASLDLSTDRIVREARFDRHFVRDLNWSRFQLEDLAERRFMAAQHENGTKFQDLFKHVSKEDFSGAISKLCTPRELMVFMTELLARVEAHSEDGGMVAAQDMEIAVTKALEQSV